MVATEASEDSLSVAAILKMYGKLGDSRAVDFVSLDMKYQILSQLQGLLDERDDDVVLDESLKIEIMAAIGLIGGNLQNVEWLAQSPCATTFLRQYATLSRDTRVAWYHSLAQILASRYIALISTNFYTQNRVKTFRLFGHNTNWYYIYNCGCPQ